MGRLNLFGQFLITFRETLEAAIIISIILAYMAKTQREHLTLYVWMGVAAAVSTSILLGLGVWFLYGTLSDSSMKLFEGIASLVAAIILTSMIIWMATHGKQMKNEINEKIEDYMKRGTRIGVVAVAFVLVFREGIETTLFLIPFATDDPGSTIVGLVLGIFCAVLVAYGVLILGRGFDLQRFFYFSSLLLIFLAAGLVGYGVHELFEYYESVGGEPGWLGSYAFNFGLSKDHPLHHKGLFGSVFAVMFGYSVKMEWARLIIHSVYLAVFLPFTIWMYSQRDG